MKLLQLAQLSLLGQVYFAISCRCREEGSDIAMCIERHKLFMHTLIVFVNLNLVSKIKIG